MGPEAQSLGTSEHESAQRLTVSCVPESWPYLCRGRDMVQGFLLTRAHGGHVGQEGLATDPGQIVGPWVSPSSLSLGLRLYKIESGTSLARDLHDGVASLYVTSCKQVCVCLRP